MCYLVKHWGGFNKNRVLLVVTQTMPAGRMGKLSLGSAALMSHTGSV